MTMALRFLGMTTLRKGFLAETPGSQPAISPTPGLSWRLIAES